MSKKARGWIVTKRTMKRRSYVACTWSRNCFLSLMSDLVGKEACNRMRIT